MKMYIIVEDGGDFNAWRGCAKRRKVINQPLGRLWTPIFHQVATFTKYLLMRVQRWGFLTRPVVHPFLSQ